MSTYSCKPAPAAGQGCYALTIDFEEPRWIQRAPGETSQPVFGIRGLYRPRTRGYKYGPAEPLPFGMWPEIIEDTDHLLRAIASLEALAFNEPQERMTT